MGSDCVEDYPPHGADPLYLPLQGEDAGAQASRSGTAKCIRCFHYHIVVHSYITLTAPKPFTAAACAAGLPSPLGECLSRLSGGWGWGL